jgi:hypothetical protein
LKQILFILLLFSAGHTIGQRSSSITTDLSVLRSFSEGQAFTVIGQTIQFQYHFTPKESGYAWINYYSPGKYKNTLTAIAKDPLTTPATTMLGVSSELRFRQVSLGWKHYFKGASNGEELFHVYGTAGFGLLVSKIENQYRQSIDTALYVIPQRSINGSKEFRRLTFDLGLGSEFQIGGGIYLYGELRTWLRASSTPSPYLYKNSTPQVAILSGGLRILFD